MILPLVTEFVKSNETLSVGVDGLGLLVGIVDGDAFGDARSNGWRAESFRLSDRMLRPAQLGVLVARRAMYRSERSRA